MRRRSGEAREIRAHVAKKGSGHNRLPRKAGLIKRLGSNLGGPAKGSIYHVPLPAALPVYDAAEAETSTLADNATVAQCATVAPAATVARHATNKDDDDDIKENHKKIKELVEDNIFHFNTPKHIMGWISFFILSFFGVR